MSPKTTGTVPPDLDDVRADRVVARVFALSRAEARRLIDAGAVHHAGRALTAAEHLAAGAHIVAELPEPGPPFQPVPVAFGIAYIDDDVVVVDKPAGVVVHPGAATDEATLIAGVAHRFPEVLDMEEQRWGLVHRLDRDTSGLLVIARNPDAFRRLQADLKARRVGRTYLALVEGCPSSARGTIDAPMGRDPHHPIRMAVRREGRPARTHFRTLASWDMAALLEVQLETGRTHQIRVHMASIEHPIVGDRVYGGRRNRHPADPGRQWLHAARLEFRHPGDDRSIAAGSPLPARLVASLDVLGTPATGDVAAWRNVIESTTPWPRGR